MTGLPQLPLPVWWLAGAEPRVPRMPGQGGHRGGERPVCVPLKAALCRARAALAARAALGRERLAPRSCAVFLFSYPRLLENLAVALTASGPSSAGSGEGDGAEPRARGVSPLGVTWGRAGLPVSARCAVLGGFSICPPALFLVPAPSRLGSGAGGRIAPFVPLDTLAFPRKSLIVFAGSARLHHCLRSPPPLCPRAWAAPGPGSKRVLCPGSRGWDGDVLAPAQLRLPALDSGSPPGAAASTAGRGVGCCPLGPPRCGDGAW